METLFDFLTVEPEPEIKQEPIKSEIEIQELPELPEVVSAPEKNKALEYVEKVDYENNEIINSYAALSVSGLFGYKENKATAPGGDVIKNDKLGITVRLNGFYFTMAECRFIQSFLVDLIRQGHSQAKISFYEIYKAMGYQGKPNKEAIEQILKTIRILSTTKIEISQKKFTFINPKTSKEKEKGGYITTGGLVGFIEDYDFTETEQGEKVGGNIKIIINKKFINAVIKSKNKKNNLILEKKLLICKSDLLSYAIEQLNSWKYSKMNLKDFYRDVKNKNWELTYKNFKFQIIKIAIERLLKFKSIEIKENTLYFSAQNITEQE